MSDQQEDDVGSIVMTVADDGSAVTVSVRTPRRDDYSDAKVSWDDWCGLISVGQSSLRGDQVDHLNRFPISHYNWRTATAKQLSQLAKAVVANSAIIQCERFLISDMLMGEARSRRARENSAKGRKK